MHPALRHILAELNGQVFIELLQKLTGRAGIIPDPHYRGAGVHLTLPGGHLDLHADFNVDRFRGLIRCATAILYLQPAPRDWRDEWEGHLELWPASLEACGARIAPAHNRLVVFAHGDAFFHGHPAPLASPEGRSRQSIAAYYYVAPGEGGLPEAHGARWVKPA